MCTIHMCTIHIQIIIFPHNNCPILLGLTRQLRLSSLFPKDTDMLAATALSLRSNRPFHIKIGNVRISLKIYQLEAVKPVTNNHVIGWHLTNLEAMFSITIKFVKIIKKWIYAIMAIIASYISQIYNICDYTIPITPP